MGALLARRFLYLIPTLFVVTLSVFALSQQADPERVAIARAGNLDASKELIEQYIEEFGLRDPFFVRYGRWLGDIAQLDLGRSMVATQAVDTDDGIRRQGVPVIDRISMALPRTLSLALVGMAFGIVIGAVVGTISGLRPGTLVDRISVMFSTLTIAMPSFWIAMLLVYAFAIKLGWLPAVGYVSPSKGILEWLKRLLLPGAALGLFTGAVLARQLRAALIDVMGSAYIRTAWAKGNGFARIVVRHALKNAAAVPVTVIGLQTGTLLGGGVVLENIFGIDGLGRLTVLSVQTGDIITLQGVIVLFVIVNVLINLAVDVAYGFLNPKIRLT